MTKLHRLLAVAALVCGFSALSNAQLAQESVLFLGTAGSGTQSLALSADGSTALVGEPTNNGGVGDVLVFVRASGVWSQQAELTPSDATGSARLGWSVALSSDGNTAFVGGPGDNQLAGAAWVFTRTNGAWAQQGGKLIGAKAVGSANQGWSVGLSEDGNTAIAGGPADNANAGAAWVFIRSGTVWSQQGNKLAGAGATGAAEQGWSVALSGDSNTALVGGWLDNSGVGAAWVFVRSGSAWSPQGSKLIGTGGVGQSHQGWSVSLSANGSTALLGAFNDNQGAGAGWVFIRSGTVWFQQAKLNETGSTGPPSLGWSAALSQDGNTAILGGDDDVGGVGAAWVFTRLGVTWTQQGSKLVGSPSATAIKQGWSVALSGDGHTAVVGSSNDDAFAFVSPKASATSLSASVNPSAFGQSITYTATVTSGATGTVTFSIDGIAQSTVPLTSSKATFPVSNLSPGTHTISAAYSGDWEFGTSTSNSLSQTVTPIGTISLWANVTVSLDGTARLPVSLAQVAPTGGLTISLASSDPSTVAITPASVFITAGKTTPAVQPSVSGVNLGRASISATCLGCTSSTQSVQVTASLAFALCCKTITHGTSTSVTLTLSAPAPATGLTIQLTSGNTAIATVPATISFPAGATSVSVPITAVAAGNATITASSLPNLAATGIRITVN